MKGRSGDRASAGTARQARDPMEEIARRLDDVLRAMADLPSPMPASGPADAGALETARRLREQERTREGTFRLMMLRNPAWDILLDLFIAREEGRAATLESLAKSTGAPHFMLVRCVATAVEAGLLVRERAAEDETSGPLLLSEEALRLMCDYFNQVEADAGAFAA